MPLTRRTWLGAEAPAWLVTRAQLQYIGDSAASIVAAVCHLFGANMKVAVYDLTAIQFARSLRALKGLLTKAAQFADQRKFTPSVLLGSRLAPDQFPLSA